MANYRPMSPERKHRRLCKYGYLLAAENRGSEGKCKTCACRRASKYREKNPPDPEINRIRVKAWSQKNPEKYKLRMRKYSLKNKYGLTIEQYQQMWDEQEGLCAICCIRPCSVIDHSHSMKEVRSLLCPQCNVGIGMFDEVLERFDAAKQYLIKHNHA